MDSDDDCELSFELWETLKSLRTTAADRRAGGPLLARLLALGLATLEDARPVITPRGRRVLVRGSEKLLDLAA